MRSISTKFVLFTSLLILIPLAIFVGVVTNLHHQNLIKIREMSETLMKNTLQAEWEEKVRMLANILAREFAKPMHERNISEMDYLVTPVMEGKDRRPGLTPRNLPVAHQRSLHPPSFELPI